MNSIPESSPATELDVQRAKKRKKSIIGIVIGAVAFVVAITLLVLSPKINHSILVSDYNQVAPKLAAVEAELADAKTAQAAYPALTSIRLSAAGALGEQSLVDAAAPAPTFSADTATALKEAGIEYTAALADLVGDSPAVGNDAVAAQVAKVREVRTSLAAELAEVNAQIGMENAESGEQKPSSKVKELELQRDDLAAQLVPEADLTVELVADYLELSVEAEKQADVDESKLTQEMLTQAKLDLAEKTEELKEVQAANEEPKTLISQLDELALTLSEPLQAAAKEAPTQVLAVVAAAPSSPASLNEAAVAAADTAAAAKKDSTVAELAKLVDGYVKSTDQVRAGHATAVAEAEAAAAAAAAGNWSGGSSDDGWYSDGDYGYSGGGGGYSGGGSGSGEWECDWGCNPTGGNWD